MKRYFKGLITGIILTIVIIFIYNIILIEEESKIPEIPDKEVNGDEATDTISIDEDENSDIDILEKLIVLPETDYDEYEAEQMIDRIFNIDKIILEELINRGVKIKLTTTNVADVEEYKYLKGVSPDGDKGIGRTWDDIPGAGGNPVVARIGYSEPSYENQHGSINLELHETAHAIDYYVFNDISIESEFYNIQNMEVYNLFPDNDYFSMNVDEYFAEVLAMFYLDEKTNIELREKAPLTHEIIEELPNKIQKY